MKSNKHSNKDQKHSDIEKKDLGSQFGKGIKKDKSGKKRLSIYDEFDEEDFDAMNYEGNSDDDMDSEDEDDD